MGRIVAQTLGEVCAWPRGTLLPLLDEFDRLGPDKGLFRHELHHLGGSFEARLQLGRCMSDHPRKWATSSCGDRLASVLSQVRSGAAAGSPDLEDADRAVLDRGPGPMSELQGARACSGLQAPPLDRHHSGCQGAHGAA